ncbi:Bacterial alpha-L-rhamnosidase [Microbacterium azadirachtae]|uniref:alpha-L-rhamnosidase n=1 Tax=Microbacterium azadirachtae TaxID=582680 RepID=A0A0F0KW00_9MICO|nr:alpha-L-rhamnosidase [Microbacterium azadirachtae]KJL24260.1 Bacterial alpha-L-rhamnosidase [Microbacterium azadirachtae]
MTNPLDDADFLTAPAPRDCAIRFFREVMPDRPRDEIQAAELIATALGIYEATIDGKPISSSVLDPGWSSYEWRLPYQTWDVTDLVREGVGPMRFELHLGNGWYRGNLGFEGANINYGDRIGVCAALRITYADGSLQTVLTSEDWSARESETVRNSLYHGQTIDARLRGAGTELPVEILDVDRARLFAQISPSVVRHESIRPVRVNWTPSDDVLVDFGQNLVGWVRMRVRGPRGTRVIIRHAEVLENDELGTRPLRAAQATDVFVLSGEDDVFEPTFTFHGFRYAEIQGWPGELDPDQLEAVVVHSELHRTGSFECSDLLINRLVENVVWGQRGNFLSVPTDCPQRDERLGWTGDIAAFAPSAAFFYDVADFLDDWLRDLRMEAEHTEGRFVPVVVPDALKYAHYDGDFSFPEIGPTAIWGDAAVWVPEALWRAYGDRERLAAHYPAMVLHLESVRRMLSPDGLWERGFQFGDWLDPDAPPENAAAAKADPHVVATACLYRSASFAAEAATILGLEDDASQWTDLAQTTRRAFQEHYLRDGRIQSDCTTVYALAIHFGLLDETDRAQAGERLAELVRVSRYRVTTGFAGTPFVTWALSETGHIDEAYRLLLERECPSWLYPVTMGATTVWERWDSMLPDGTINPGEMTSFNHYALGAVADWIFQVVGGIRPLEPGYGRILIQPRPGPGITWASAHYTSRAGDIDVSWTLDDGSFALVTTIPDGGLAKIVLPNGTTHHVTGGTHRFTQSLSSLAEPG